MSAGFILADPKQESEVEIYLKPSELCARYKGAITEKTLSNWRYQGEGPAYLKIGGKILYRLSDVLLWEMKRRSAAALFLQLGFLSHL